MSEEGLITFPGFSLHVSSIVGVFNTSGGYHEYIGGYLEYIRGCSVIRTFQNKSKAFMNLFPHMNHDSPRCHEYPLIYSRYPLMYSWYPPNVLMVSPRCTEHTLYRLLHSSNTKINPAGPTNRCRLR